MFLREVFNSCKSQSQNLFSKELIYNISIDNITSWMFEVLHTGTYKIHVDIVDLKPSLRQ